LIPSDDRWDRLIRGLRENDPEIVSEFCRHYGRLLEQVAEAHLAPQLRRRVEPEDVTQSVCRTFLRRVQGGEFQLPDSDSLWRLLCVITVMKVRQQARFHHRQRRGIDREVAVDFNPCDSQIEPFTPADRTPTPGEAAELSDQLRSVLSCLSGEEQRIVELKLKDYTNDEVAHELRCSERTVRRVLHQLQSRLLQAFGMVSI